MRLKSLFIVLTFLCLTNAASSQVVIALLFGDKLNNEKIEFGLNIGGNLSTLTNVENDNYRTGLNLGLNFVFTLNKSFQINPSLYFKYPLGAADLPVYTLPDANLNALLDDANLNREFNYFSLPVTLRYRVFGKTYFEFGPQFMLNTTANDVFTTEVHDADNLSYTNPYRDNIKAFDVGYTVGISHKLPKDHAVTLTLRFFESLLDIDKLDFGTQRNRAFTFSVGIPVGTASKEEIKE